MSKSIKCLFSFIVLSIFFISCNNFLSGSNLKNEIENEIEYNLSEERIVYISADPGTGVFNGVSGPQKLKVTDFVNLDFTPAENYIFVGWKIYDNKLREIIEDGKTYINIFEPEKCVSQAQFIEDRNDLLIKPYCIEQPSITGTNIDDGKLINASTIIKVNFSLSMEDYTLDYNTIRIIDSKGFDITDYFYKPELSENYKTLKFIPKAELLAAHINSYNVSSDVITINFTDKIVKQFENVEIPLFQNSYSVLNINCSSIIETTPPEFNSFVVTKTNKSSSVPLVIKNYSLFDKEDHSEEGDMYKNLVGDFLYFDFSVYDSESGINMIEIYERQTYTKTAGPLDREPYHKNSEFAYDYKTSYFYEDLLINDSNVLFKKEYKVKTQDSGVVDFKVVVYDNSGNKQIKEFSIIHFSYDVPTFKLFNNWYFEDDYNNEFVYVINGNSRKELLNEYNKQIRKIFLDIDVADWQYFDIYQNKFSIKKDSLNFYYEYIDDSGNVITSKLEKNKTGFYEHSKWLEGENSWYEYFDEEQLCSFTLENVSNLDGYKFKIIVEQDELFSREFEFNFPSKSKIYGVRSNSNIITSLDSPYKLGYIIVDDDYLISTCEDCNNVVVEAEYEYKPFGSTSELLVLDSPDYYSYGINVYTLDNDNFSEDETLYSQFRLFGQIDQDNYISASDEKLEDLSDSQLKFSNVEYKKGSTNSNEINLEFTINESYWEQYDSIFIEIELLNRNLQNEKIFFTPGTSVVSLTASGGFFTYYDLGITLRAIKNNVYIEGEQRTLLKLTNIPENSYLDAYPPYVSYISAPSAWVEDSLTFHNYYGEYICIESKESTNELSKIHSDISDVYYSINFEDIAKCSDVVSTESSIKQKRIVYKVPLFDLVEGDNILYAKAFDIEGNYATKTDRINILKLPDLTFSGDYLVINRVLVEAALESSEVKGSSLWLSLSNFRFNCLKWDSNTWSDVAKNEYVSNSTESEYKKFINSVPLNTYIKFNYSYRYSNFRLLYYSNWGYAYTGTPSTINKKLVNDSGIFVASDQPVYIRTLITKKSYDECKNWTYDEWNTRHQSVNEEVLMFSPENTNLQIYEYKDIPDNYCYKVFIQYANGEIQSSPVYQK